MEEHHGGRKGLQLGEQLADRDLQAIRDDFQVQETDVSFTALDIGKVAAVESQYVSHFRLRPAAALAQMSQAFAEIDPDVWTGHLTIIRRRLSATNRI